MDWSKYRLHTTAEAENQPARDLARRVDILVRKAADLGSGSGSSTRALEETFHEAKVTGMDRDPEMTRLARRRHPECTFETRDLRDLQGSWDLIFSNAALQWVPDHEQVIPQLMEHLEPDGVLAVGMPVADGEPVFEIMEELIRSNYPGLPVRDYVLDAARYRKILKDCASSWDYWETDYYYHDVDPDSLARWLVPARLEPAEGIREEDIPRITEELTERIRQTCELDEEGCLPLRIRRIFFTAVR